MLRLICSTGISFSLGCACLGKFPTDRVWEFDSKDKVCGEYQIIQYEPKLRFKHLRDVPLAQCPAIFGFTAKDIPAVLDHYEDAVRCTKERCQ